MHWLDLAIVGFITWTTFRAFRKGLVREVVHIVALVGGVIVAGQYYGQLSSNLNFLLEDKNTLPLLLCLHVLKPIANPLNLSVFNNGLFL